MDGDCLYRSAQIHRTHEIAYQGDARPPMLAVLTLPSSDVLSGTFQELTLRHRERVPRGDVADRVGQLSPGPHGSAKCPQEALSNRPQ